MNTNGSGWPVVCYLGGVLTLAGAIVLMLGWLFFSRVPAFPNAVVRNPAAAVDKFPIAVLVLVGVSVCTLLLLVLVVGFGARYGPDAPRNGGPESGAKQ